MREDKQEAKAHYRVRRVHLGRTEQLDDLAHVCGDLYSRTLVFFWRTVRHKGIWLKAKHLMRLFTSDQLHAHTSDACVQAFFAALPSWRERRKTDPNARPPRRRKWYFRIEYKSSAIILKDSLLFLSNGRTNAPLVLFWQWERPKTVVVHWTGTEYEAIATYQVGLEKPAEEERSVEERRIEHKQTSSLVNTLHREGVEKLVIGDVREIRHGLDKGSTTNQKLHQWSFGSVRHKLTYKATHLGMRVVLHEEIR
jgi:IS605 OrfB family transposase